MVSHPETGSYPPIGSDWESGRDRSSAKGVMYSAFFTLFHSYLNPH